MEATARQYYKIKEVAEITGLDRQTVRDYSHADGQDFAFQAVKNGNIMIDLNAFRRWLEKFGRVRNRPGTR